VGVRWRRLGVRDGRWRPVDLDLDAPGRFRVARPVLAPKLEAVNAVSVDDHVRAELLRTIVDPEVCYPHTRERVIGNQVDGDVRVVPARRRRCNGGWRRAV